MSPRSNNTATNPYLKSPNSVSGMVEVDGTDRATIKDLVLSISDRNINIDKHTGDGMLPHRKKGEDHNDSRREIVTRSRSLSLDGDSIDGELRWERREQAHPTATKKRIGLGKKRVSFSKIECEVREEEPYEWRNKSECEALYGPYPPSIPTPRLDANGRTPPSSSLKRASSMWDLQDSPDYRDKGTPDEWIPRDGRLIRLAGRHHPFNAEPPLAVLNATRFLTPAHLHYVRNHGAVPDLRWDEHTLAIGGPEGLVPNPYAMSMDELVAVEETREFPCTLVCAGNRGKEQNAMRRTVGLDWGPCGASTSVWKGVPLRELLLRAGVSEKDTRGKHVEFIGAEDLPNKVGPEPFKKEPWGEDVKYGTSVQLARAMNPAYDIIVAYQANGEVLHPDHGYPIRIIIPGYIGGRMIKWLGRINVIGHETRNQFHYHDNRIFPPHVTAESLKNDGWYKEEYMFNELNINSVISQPDHDETLSIATKINEMYEVAGYAYSGGGRKVTRVEVSTDNGTNWNLCETQYTERPTEYGMHWCWIWWKYNLNVADLLGCDEIWCRAWDESNNTQSIEPTWNLMGMGNNHVFRVKVKICRTKMGEHVLRFEHPTQPGQQTGGWMTRRAGQPESAGFGRLLEEHINAEARKADHVEKAKTLKAASISTEPKMVADQTVISEQQQKSSSREVRDKCSEAPVALDPRRKVTLPLRSKTILSRDSFVLEFALPSPNHALGLPTGKHVFLSGNMNGERVMRRYTPVSSDRDIGKVLFVIKAYRPTDRFPQGGKMSRYLDSLRPGVDTIDVRGPLGEFEYVTRGSFLMKGDEHKAAKFNMIAGGTGITPCVQVAAEILRQSPEEDPTQLSLVFACREEGDLLLRSTLDEWSKAYPDRFKVHYVLSDAWPKDWKHSTGFVTKSLFQEHLFGPGDDVYNLMCGPPVMLDKGCTPNLLALGHEKDRMFAF